MSGKRQKREMITTTTKNQFCIANNPTIKEVTKNPELWITHSTKLEITNWLKTVAAVANSKERYALLQAISICENKYLEFFCPVLKQVPKESHFFIFNQNELHKISSLHEQIRILLPLGHVQQSEAPKIICNILTTPIHADQMLFKEAGHTEIVDWLKNHFSNAPQENQLEFLRQACCWGKKAITKKLDSAFISLKQTIPNPNFNHDYVSLFLNRNFYTQLTETTPINVVFMLGRKLLKGTKPDIIKKWLSTYLLSASETIQNNFINEVLTWDEPAKEKLLNATSSIRINHPTNYFLTHLHNLLSLDSVKTSPLGEPSSPNNQGNIIDLTAQNYSGEKEALSSTPPAITAKEEYKPDAWSETHLNQQDFFYSNSSTLFTGKISLLPNITPSDLKELGLTLHDFIP